ncbi:hydroxyacid dehydrogenase [Brachybacterium paraconglomeratum]|uniref:hydroxyacid dehydrogenase n=1 Tax=Brachybacterium paraconglomeratum TaxID=173362 RepID=UPI0031E6006C
MPVPTQPDRAPRIFMAITPKELGVLYSEAALERLRRVGEVVLPPESGDARVHLPEGLADDYDVLITSWSTAPFDPSALSGSRLKYAAHTAGTVRGLFPKHVLEQGLRLAQGGSAAMATAVAELALTFTLVLLRDVHSMDRRLQATRDWKAGGSGVLTHGIREQTIGVLSLSRVGREYVSMVRGLGVRTVLAHDPFATADDAAALGVQLVGLAELCERSDVLAIHAPVTDETRGMLDAAMLARLRDGATVLNTARSAVIDMESLTAELVAGRLRAGLDVFDSEPLVEESPLYGLDNVLITPHVAGGTVEARRAQGDGVVEEITSFLTGAPLRYEVTPEIYDRLS